MGEEVSAPEGFFDDEPEEKKEVYRVKSNLSTEQLQKTIMDLLKKGHKHDDIFKSLRVMGYGFSEIETALSNADLILDAQHSKRADPRIIAIAAVAVIGLLGFVVLSGFIFVPKGQDCAEDQLCADKILQCAEGVFESSFSGVKRQYEISRSADQCRVAVSILSAGAESLEQKGMSMVCNYPISVGLTDRTDRSCTGNLADLYN